MHTYIHTYSPLLVFNMHTWNFRCFKVASCLLLAHTLKFSLMSSLLPKMCSSVLTILVSSMVNVTILMGIPLHKPIYLIEMIWQTQWIMPNYTSAILCNTGSYSHSHGSLSFILCRTFVSDCTTDKMANTACNRSNYHSLNQQHCHEGNATENLIYCDGNSLTIKA